MANSGRSVSTVSNVELYDRWAQTYDTDGNILQAIDDQEIPNLLNDLFGQIDINESTSQSSRLKITDLGCGTGRNTSKLLQTPFRERISEICGLDVSENMLEIARQRCAAEDDTLQLSLHTYNALGDSPPSKALGADIVISTLVLEHIPIETFFTTVRKILKKDGYLLLTGMHAEMGQLSRAGFLDEAVNEKVQGHSFVYGNSEVVGEAKKRGLELVGDVKERRVEKEDLVSLGGRGRKWIGCKVWLGCLFVKGEVS